MTDKQNVIDALTSMPEKASLDEIIEELCILAAVRGGRTDIAAGPFTTQEKIEQLAASWFPHSPCSQS